MKSTEIIILGGGYVGVLAYQSLIKSLGSQIKSGSVRMTVICPLHDHTFHGWTSETLTGVIQTKNQLSPLSEVMSKATHIFGQAEAVDSDKNLVTVKLEDGSLINMRYDHLLIGFGSFDSEKMEGLWQHGYQVKSREAFHKTRDKIYQLVQEAAVSTPEQARELLTFTLAGGGFTGVELAANVSEYVRVLKKSHAALKDINPTVRLIHSGSRLLSALPEHCDRLVEYAETTLANFDIEVIKNRRITRIEPFGVYLDDASYLPGSMVISTVGQSRVLLDGTEDWLRDGAGRLHTNAFLQINGMRNIWGGGDACHVMRHRKGIPCPSNALWAIKHGEAVGLNIARAISGKRLKPFTFKGLGEAASLGMGKGIGELYGMQFTGMLAWVLRWFFFHYFMPSRRVMLRSMGDWMYLFFTGKRKGISAMENATMNRSATQFPAYDLFTQR